MNYPTINKVETFWAHFNPGPWTTKSGGELSVITAIPKIISMNFITKKFPIYDSSELAKIPKIDKFDIRGLRIYSVSKLPANKIGGTEFHRIRQEIIIGLDGELAWKFEDISGNTTTINMTTGLGIYIPPFIRHTYKVMREGSSIVVICNTLFIPDNPRTHDTYSENEFMQLRETISGTVAK